MQNIIAHAPQYLQIATSIVGIASMVAALTPSPADDGVLRAVRKALDFLAFNFGNASNK